MTERQTWIAIVAKASLTQLEEGIQRLGELPPHRWLKPPEMGLVMVRGRADGSGQSFNLGEMPMTRCVLQVEDPESQDWIAGFGYVAGRSRRHAELAAICDALMQIPAWRTRIHTQVLEPLQAAALQARQQQDQQTAATQVNFFTMVRGE